MADISKVTLPDNETYDLKDSVAREGIGNAKLFYGTCSSAAATTEKAVTCSEFTANDLVAGTMINVKFDATNSGAVASLTLNVNGTGAKSIKYIYNNERNNIPAAGYLLKDNMYTFRYDGTYWVAQLMYNTNTTTGYGYYDYYFRACAGTSAIYRYKIVGMGEDNRLYPIVTTNQTSATQVAKAVQTTGIRPGHLWIYYSTTTASAGGAIAAATLLAGGGANTVGAYSFNESIPTYRTIYLRGTYDREKDLFYLYDDGATPCKSYYTFVPTNSAVTLSDYFVEGNYYMIVGGSYSSENYFSIFADNPLYYFDGTNLIPVSTKVAKDLVDNAPYVPTTRKINNKALSSDITLTASDVGAVPTSRTVNGKALSSNISLTASDVGALGLNGDASNTTATFTQATSRNNIATGTTIATAFSRISKWFADLGSLAFKSSVAKTDLASDVQTSLGKADTALQSYTETDPTVPSWAKASTKPTYTASEVGALPSTTPIPAQVSKLYTATCSTAAATAAKVATLDDSTGFSLTAGVRVAVTFTYGNTATTPTLNVSSSGAKTIAIPSSATAFTTGSGTTYNTWGAYETVIFTYTGTYWVHDTSGRLGYLAYSGLGSKANTASPTFTGTPAAPTATAGTNTTQIATTAFVQTAISSVASSSGWKEVQRYTSAGTYTWTVPKTAKYGVFVVGGGGGGAKTTASSGRAAGGSSGFTASAVVQLSSGISVPIVVGAGGTGVTTAGAGASGGMSSFNAVLIAAGGSGGTNNKNAANYGSGAIAGSCYSSALYQNGYGASSGKVLISQTAGFAAGAPWSARNPFTGEDCLGAGGSVVLNSSGKYSGSFGGGKNPITGLGGGNPGYGDLTDSYIAAEDATEFGCGGGAFASNYWTSSKSSGAGADGIVIIYEKLE